MTCLNCNKKKFIAKGISIAKGVANYVFDNPEIEAIAGPRLSICNSCPFRKVLAEIGDKTIYKCEVCNCLLELKTRVKEESCPKGKW